MHRKVILIVFILVTLVAAVLYYSRNIATERFVSNSQEISVIDLPYDDTRYAPRVIADLSHDTSMYQALVDKLNAGSRRHVNILDLIEHKLRGFANRETNTFALFELRDVPPDISVTSLYVFPVNSSDGRLSGEQIPYSMRGESEGHLVYFTSLMLPLESSIEESEHGLLWEGDYVIGLKGEASSGETLLRYFEISVPTKEITTPALHYALAWSMGTGDFNFWDHLNRAERGFTCVINIDMPFSNGLLVTAFPKISDSAKSYRVRSGESISITRKTKGFSLALYDMGKNYALCYIHSVSTDSLVLSRAAELTVSGFSTVPICISLESLNIDASVEAGTIAVFYGHDLELPLSWSKVDGKVVCLVLPYGAFELWLIGEDEVLVRRLGKLTSVRGDREFVILLPDDTSFGVKAY